MLDRPMQGHGRTHVAARCSRQHTASCSHGLHRQLQQLQLFSLPGAAPPCGVATVRAYSGGRSSSGGQSDVQQSSKQHHGSKSAEADAVKGSSRSEAEESVRSLLIRSFEDPEAAAKLSQLTAARKAAQPANAGVKLPQTTVTADAAKPITAKPRARLQQVTPKATALKKDQRPVQAAKQPAEVQGLSPWTAKPVPPPKAAAVPQPEKAVVKISPCPPAPLWPELKAAADAAAAARMANAQAAAESTAAPPVFDGTDELIAALEGKFAAPPAASSEAASSPAPKAMPVVTPQDVAAAKKRIAQFKEEALALRGGYASNFVLSPVWLMQHGIDPLVCWGLCLITSACVLFGPMHEAW